MQRLKMLRLLLQNVPIDALGVRQPSLLMRLCCLHEFGVERRRGRFLRLELPNILWRHHCVPKSAFSVMIAENGRMRSASSGMGRDLHRAGGPGNKPAASTALAACQGGP